VGQRVKGFFYCHRINHHTLNEMNGTGWTPLVSACMSGQVEETRMLLQRNSINANKTLPGHGGFRGKTPLYIACYHNHVAIVRLLLAWPMIDINLGDPLEVACRKGHTRIVWLFVRTTHLTRWSLKAGLRSAASWGHLDIVMLLMVQGADAGGSIHNPGMGALKLAQMGHHTAISTFFVEFDRVPLGSMVVHYCLGPALAVALRTGRVPAEEVQRFRRLTDELQPPCKQTMDIMNRALVWDPTSHWLFDQPFRAMVHTCMLLKARCANGDNRPTLPTEMWWCILSWVTRAMTDP
jgi:hypothetical protein